MADNLGRDPEVGPVEARIEIGGARITVPDLGRLVAGGVSWPASQSRTLLALFADSRCAMTEPAEPPPTMIVSYTLAFPLVDLVLARAKLAHLAMRVTPGLACASAASKW